MFEYCKIEPRVFQTKYWGKLNSIPKSISFKQWKHQVSNNIWTASQYDYERSPIMNKFRPMHSLSVWPSY